jgi:hypothetical protein
MNLIKNSKLYYDWIDTDNEINLQYVGFSEITSHTWDLTDSATIQASWTQCMFNIHYVQRILFNQTYSVRRAHVSCYHQRVFII